jgi:hypothetical protein
MNLLRAIRPGSMIWTLYDGKIKTTEPTDEQRPQTPG